MLSKLWIMRHGLAVDHFDSDFTRALSEVGKAQALDASRQLLSDGHSLPQEMLVSPFCRTVETANVVHQQLSLKSPYKIDEMLVHFGDHKLLGDFLLASDYTNLIIVSHMPIVARLCQYLAPGCEIYSFETAQIVRLDFTQSKKTVNARVAQVITAKVEV